MEGYSSLEEGNFWQNLVLPLKEVVKDNYTDQITSWINDVKDIKGNSMKFILQAVGFSNIVAFLEDGKKIYSAFRHVVTFEGLAN